MHRRGIALISVLMMSSLMLLMVLCLFLASRGSLFGTMENQRRLQALYVAEAGLAETMAYLEDNAFTAPANLSGSLPSGGTWSVRFVSGPPFTQDDSVNNLTNAGSYAASHRGGTSVPPASALIVVTASYAGVERQLEAIITRGTVAGGFANAIQASGTLHLGGDVSVNGVTSLTDSTPVPGNLHSNKASGPTITWDGAGTADITGTVTAPAGAASIDLQGYTPGGGAPGVGGTAPFPLENIVSKVGSMSGSTPAVIAPSGTTSLGAGAQYAGSSTTVNGDLVLNGTDLYVQGDLSVNGSITGKGSIYVTGETTFRGDSRVVTNQTDHGVALYSHGSVSLLGFDGSAYMAAIGDPTLDDIWHNQVTPELTGAQSILNGAPDPATLVSDTTLDTHRRKLGYYNDGTSNYDAFGRLSARLEAVGPAGVQRDFLVKKFDNLSLFFGTDGAAPTFTGTDPTQNLVDWDGGLNPAGIMDSIMDGGRGDLMGQMVTIVNQVDPNRIGNSYFQGMVYTNGYIYAANEISVVGGVMAKGDTSLPGATINGVTLKPGDIYLANGVEVTFVEEFMQNGPMTGAGTTVSVETWLGR